MMITINQNEHTVDDPVDDREVEVGVQVVEVVVVVG